MRRFDSPSTILMLLAQRSFFPRQTILVASSLHPTLNTPQSTNHTRPNLTRRLLQYLLRLESVLSKLGLLVRDLLSQLLQLLLLSLPDGIVFRCLLPLGEGIALRLSAGAWSSGVAFGHFTGNGGEGARCGCCCFSELGECSGEVAGEHGWWVSLVGFRGWTG